MHTQPRANHNPLLHGHCQGQNDSTTKEAMAHTLDLRPNRLQCRLKVGNYEAVAVVLHEVQGEFVGLLQLKAALVYAKHRTNIQVLYTQWGTTRVKLLHTKAPLRKSAQVTKYCRVPSGLLCEMQ